MMCGGSEWGVVCVLLESCGIRSAVCMRTDNGERGESGEFGYDVAEGDGAGREVSWAWALRSVARLALRGVVDRGRRTR